MVQPMLETACDADIAIPHRLWVYTNYDCNLSCTYCVAKSSPRAERRGMSMANFRQVVSETAEAGIEELFLTGGEPFILPDIVERLEVATSAMPTRVLTNAMLLQGARLERLLALRDRPLILQVSLDGHEAALHDAYRGSGAWAKTVESVRALTGLGFHVAIGATETPVNTASIDDLRAFVATLGIADKDFFVRPLARRGLSREGMELGVEDLVPEMTVNNDGVYWHPLTTEEDMLLTRRIFPIRGALELLHERYHAVLSTGAVPRPFR